MTKLTLEDADLIEAIGRRAREFAEQNADIFRPQTIDAFTLEAVEVVALAHLHSALHLKALLHATDMDFIHDVCGIRQHIDRETGAMRDCFEPRFARSQWPG